MRYLAISGLAVLFICLSCKTKQDISNEVFITGAIKNHDETVLKFQDFMGKSDWFNEIAVNDGKFSISLSIDQPTIKMLTYGSTFKNIYLQPGETLDLSFDASKTDGSFMFGGSLATENVVLDSLKSEQSKLDYNYVYTQSLENAGKYLDSMTTANKQYIEDLTADKEVPKNFKDYATALIEYNNAYLKIVLGERKEEQPDKYYDFLNQLTLENEKYLDIFEYRMFLNEYLTKQSNERLKKLDSVDISKPQAFFDANMSAIKELKNDDVRAYALFNAMHMRLKENGIDGFENYYNYFKANNQDPGYAEQLKAIYEEKQLMAPGQPAPAFTLQDVDGQMVSLDDFKGKYVYVDFWQTLCPRSARELPYLLNLHADYQDQNIEFVSISVNVDETVWRDYVKEHKNMGTSLRVPKSWDSKTYKDYQVFGLPTFILIDPEGNIIDAKAAKPSSEEIRARFDELLKSK